MRRPERGVLGRRPHREFVAVGLADHHRARAFEPLDRGGVVWRDERLEDLRRRRRSHAARAQIVLERHRHAGERRVAPPIAIAIQIGRARQRTLRDDSVKGVQCGIGRADARERVAADLRRGARAAPHALPKIADGVRRDRRGHPMTRGTLKNDPSGVSGAGSGALASASARSRHGRTSSPRSDVPPGGEVRRGGDAGRVDLLELAHVGEDVAQLTSKQLDLGRRQVEVGQRGD